MNILFYVGDRVVSYAFPQVGAALTTMRHARTVYNIFKAGVSVASGDVMGGGVALAAGALSVFGGPSIGPGNPIPGVNPEYIECVNDCWRTCGHTWEITMCLAGCERFR